MTLPSTQDFDAEEIDRGSRQGQTNDNPSADLVRVYLNGIGKTALLTAEDEVQLAQTIEVGLYAEHLLENSEEPLTRAMKRDLKVLARQGKHARSHLLEANLRLVVSLAKRYTGRGMPLLDLIHPWDGRSVPHYSPSCAFGGAGKQAVPHQAGALPKPRA